MPVSHVARIRRDEHEEHRHRMNRERMSRGASMTFGDQIAVIDSAVNAYWRNRPKARTSQKSA